MVALEMTSTKTWGAFLDPYCGGGGKWRPLHFRSPSWMTSFPEAEIRSSKMAAGSGRAAIFHHHHNGGPKTRPILLAEIFIWRVLISITSVKSLQFIWRSIRCANESKTRGREIRGYQANGLKWPSGHMFTNQYPKWQCPSNSDKIGLIRHVFL